METMMPSRVRKLRSLCDHKVSSATSSDSFICTACAALVGGLRPRPPAGRLRLAARGKRSLARTLAPALGDLVAGDLAVADVDDAVGEFGDVGLVGDQHDGVAQIPELVHER